MASPPSFCHRLGMIGGQGLTKVPTGTLKLLLRTVHSGALPCPITVEGLHAAGLGHLLGLTEPLHGLETAGVRAVLTAVLAERIKAERAGRPPGR